MSIIKYSILLFALALISSLVYFRSEKPTVKQFPTFAGINQSIYTNRGVVDRIIQVDLSFKNDSEENQNIVAEVTLPFDYRETLNYKWTLGENVKLTSGNLTGTISDFNGNSPKTITFSVSGFTKKENRHISFEIFGKKNGKVIYGESLLASQLENTFENTVQNVERIKASRLEKPRE
jgi:hypothetical protein